RIDVRRLAQRLGETYRPLLERHVLELTLDRLEVRPPMVPSAERRAFAINTGGARVRGWVGLSDPEHATGGWVPGIRCYRLGRPAGSLRRFRAGEVYGCETTRAPRAATRGAGARCVGPRTSHAAAFAALHTARGAKARLRDHCHPAARPRGSQHDRARGWGAH